MNGASSVNRAALGNSASLGDLYDARRDDFCGISIFKKAIPATARTLVDSQFSDIHLVYTEDFSEKVTKLDVSAELQVSVLAGLFTLQGSGRYLSDQKTSARSVKSSLLYNIKTKQESVNIYHEDLRDAFSIDAIENGTATHVVVGIEWGANSIVSCLYENKENRDVKEISGSLSAQLKKFSLSISGKADVKYDDAEKSSGIKFDIRMYGDVLPKNGELPTTFEGALDLMKKLPSLVAASNDGKGKPLRYRLIPVSVFQKYLKFEIQADAVIKTIEERSLVRVVQLFDQMSKAQQQLNDFYQDAFQFKYCVLPADLKKVADLKDEMKLQETTFRSELCAVLTQIRSGKADVAQLEKILETIQSSSVSPEKVSATLASWSDVIERINFVRALVKQGATFIGIGKSLDEELLHNFEDKFYVLYFSQKAKKDDPEKWGGNRRLFFQQMKKRDDGNRYLVVDCDITPSSKVKPGSSCIQVVQSCQVLVADLLAEQKQMSQMSFVQAVEDAKRIIDKRPAKRATLSIVCPGKTCSKTKVHDWHCKRCMKIVEYGFDNHIYCDCGRTVAASLDFKCSDPKHGVSFDRHDVEYMTHVLSTLKSSLNILVLGDTAEARAIWIKNIVTLLKYNSLDELESGDCSEIIDHHPIPGGNIHLASVGSTTIRFIDGTFTEKTDGSGLKKLVCSLSHLDGIHGICNLFDPTSADAHNVFSALCKELTATYGQGGRNNLLFSVKNEDKSSRKGQLALLALKKLSFENRNAGIVVNNDTVYYFGRKMGGDFLLLNAGSNHASRFAVGENEVCDWKEYVHEAHRMLKYIRELKPLLVPTPTPPAPPTPPVNKVDYRLSCQMDANQSLWVPIGKGLSHGDNICIGGRPKRGYKHFSIAFYDGIRQKSIFHFDMSPERTYCNVSGPVTLINWWFNNGGTKRAVNSFYPFVEERQFQIKIFYNRNSYRVLADGKYWFDLPHQNRLSNVRYIEFNDAMVLTLIEITRSS